MRVVLVTPPHSNPTGPTLGIAVLSSFINANFQDISTEVVDLSIKSFHYLLSSERLLYFRELLDRQISQLESQEQLVYQDLLSLKRKHIAKHRIDTYVLEVKRAMDILRDTEKYGIPEERERSIMIINALLDSIGVACSNRITLSAGDYRSFLSPFSTSDIIEYVNDTDNPYYDFFEDWIEQYDMREVSMVAISISFAKQMLPAIQLAKMIKEKYPSIFVQLGGSMMAHLKAEKFHPLFQYCDAIVQKEGEIPLYNTLKKLKLGKKLDATDGAFFLDNSNKLVFPENTQSIDVSKEKTPDFSTIKFSDYLVPFPVIPLQIGRTCYWAKCSFCCLNVAFSHKNLWRTANQIVGYIQDVVEKNHVNTFEFVDDAIPPLLAEKISDLLLSKGISIHWFTYARFDPKFTKELLKKMHNAGCVGLKFGLESASPRVLELMNKGIDLQQVQRIVKDALAIGMHCQVGFFVGFPTESVLDRETTVKFLREYVVPFGGVLTYNGWFRILKDMPIVQKEGFKNRITKWNMDEDLMDYYVFETTTFDEMLQFSRYLKQELFENISIDYVRSVDRRRYWFSGLCAIEDIKWGKEGAIRVETHYKLDCINEFRDKKFDDFRPGKGIYSTKSYISTNLLGDDTAIILNKLIVQNRGKLKSIEINF